MSRTTFLILLVGFAASPGVHAQEPAQPWGNTRSEDDLKLFGNFGHLHTSGLQLYSHANYTHKTSTQPTSSASPAAGRCSSETCSMRTTASETGRPAVPP